MRGMPRLVVCAVVALALVGATFAGCTSTRRAAVPAALVGVWKGGSHGNGPWFYEFSADGGYRTWPERDPATVNRGTVDVDGADITFSNGGAPVTSTWSLSNGVLLLDGQTYARPG
jgi:hypothetical protein